MSAPRWWSTPPLVDGLLAAGMLLGSAPERAFPQTRDAEPYRVQRLNGPIQLDGRSDELAWQSIEALPTVSSFPVFGATPSELTEFRIAYDDAHLYIAGRLYDRDPRGIRATSLRRDDGSFSNDWFAVNLDTFRDRETALVFGVNPASVRTDVAFSSDGAASNFTWNTFWDARSVVAEDGWHAEIRIPLSSLRFEEHAGVLTMGISIWRRIARKNEMVTWPAIDHQWGALSIFKASQMTEIELRGVQRSNPVYVTPYVLAGSSRTALIDPDRLAFAMTERHAREAGLDVKYSPASNLTLDVTVNTDFAQVEADDQQVNLSRFSLFFPEKRLFFQERASVFEYELGGRDELFYSRRIGLQNNEPVRIYGGIRAVGRVAGWDVGLLDMQTAETAEYPSENAAVLRVRRRVLNDNSYAGGIVTSRIDAHGAANLAGGADALLRIGRQDYLTLAFAGTSNAQDSLNHSDRLFARAHLDRRGIYGLLYQAEVAHVGREFLPSLGFLARRDHARAGGRIAYGVRMPARSRLMRVSVEAEGMAYRRYVDGALETLEAVVEWEAETRASASLSVGAIARHENLLVPFPIGTHSVFPGKYSFAGARISATPPAGSLLRVSAAAEAGRFFDGRRVSLSVSPVWNPDRRIQLSGAYQLDRIDFDTHNQPFIAHVARLRSQIMLNSALSGVVFGQYNSLIDAVTLNGRIRWNMREGNDLYLVYNHGLNMDRFEYSPVRPSTSNQTLLVKYSHTAAF